MYNQGGGYLDRIRANQLKNIQLRKKLQQAKLNHAREMLRQTNQQSMRQIETCIERMDEFEKKQKEEALETLLRETLAQTKQMAEQLSDRRAPVEINETPPEPVTRTRRPRKAVEPTIVEKEEELPEPRSPSITSTTSEVKIKVPTELEPEDGWGEINPSDLGWTEEDQQLFEDGGESSDDETEKDSKSLAEIEKEKKEREQKAKRKLELARHGDSRRPRWRLELEDELSDEQIENRMMDPLEVFRSAVYAVMFVRCVNESYVNKKLSTRDEEQQDINNMMNLYFDSTRAWLSKIVRLPVISVLQEPKLDFERIVLKKKTNRASLLFNSNTDKMLMIKMRVRVKGIIDAIIKSTEKKKLPQSIANFLKRMTTDGVYFPKDYLFPQEHQVLEFNRFGATIQMAKDFDSDNDDLSGTNARCRMVIVNLLVTRILIPHIVLEPWTCNIGSRPKAKTVSTNLKIIASLLFAIVSKEFPLFKAGVDTTEIEQPSETTKPTGSKFGFRKSKKVSSESKQDEKPTAETSETDQVESFETDEVVAPEQDKHAIDSSKFYSAEHIGSQLYALEYFAKVETELDTFLQEQRLRLRGWVSQVLDIITAEEKAVDTTQECQD